MQLVVLGMHRSGTSMVTRLLNLLGASLGPQEYIVAPDAKNPAGYWERADVFGINEELLGAAGKSWDRPDGFDPASVPAEAMRLFEARARAIVANINPFETWVIKDPRLCILFPLWRPMLERPLCIVAHRNPIDVAHSLLARDGIPLDRGLELWELYTRSALAATSEVPRLIVSYDAILADPATVTRRMLADLVSDGAKDLRWPEAGASAGFVDTGLCHHYTPPHETMKILNDGQRELCALLGDGVVVR